MTKRAKRVFDPPTAHQSIKVEMEGVAGIVGRTDQIMAAVLRGADHRR